MSTITEVSVPASEFALEAAFDSVPEIEVEFDRVVARDGDQPMPHLWVRGPDEPRATRALSADPSIETVEHLSTLEDRQLYQVEWGEAARETIDTLLSENVSILEALGVDGRWQIDLLFPDWEDLSSFYSVCANGGPSIDFRTIGPLDASPWFGQRDLSDKQRGTLRSALELGYYDVPRRITLTELAAELDVSH